MIKSTILDGQTGDLTHPGQSYEQKTDFSLKNHIFEYFAYKPILDSFKVGFDPLELQILSWAFDWCD